MGVIAQINFDKYPKQGSWLNKKVKVCYYYDFSQTHEGIIVRDDDEEPFKTIIHIPTENRYLLATECQYQILD